MLSLHFPQPPLAFNLPKSFPIFLGTRLSIKNLQQGNEAAKARKEAFSQVSFLNFAGLRDSIFINELLILNIFMRSF